MKAYLVGHSTSVESREMYSFWAPLKVVDFWDHGNVSAPDASRFLWDHKEPYSAHEQTKHSKIQWSFASLFSLGICSDLQTRLHCVAMASICLAGQQHSNSSLIFIFWGSFSADPACSTAFRMCILLWLASFSSKSTVFWIGANLTHP